MLATLGSCQPGPLEDSQPVDAQPASELPDPSSRFPGVGAYAEAVAAGEAQTERWQSLQDRWEALPDTIGGISVFDLRFDRSARAELGARRDELARRIGETVDQRDSLRTILQRADSLLGVVDALSADEAESLSLEELARDRFALFTGCRPVMPSFAGQAFDAQEMANTRFRAAGLQHGTDEHDRWSAVLYVSANAERAWLVKPGITAGMVLLWDPLSGEFGQASTWERRYPPLESLSEITDEDPGRSFADVFEIEESRRAARMSEIVDDFISEYLRVNGDACQ